MTPCAHSHSTRSGVLWPVRLSHTSNSRSGGRSSGRVKGIVSPACHTFHAARGTAGSRAEADAGTCVRISLKRSRNRGCPCRARRITAGQVGAQHAARNGQGRPALRCGSRRLRRSGASGVLRASGPWRRPRRTSREDGRPSANRAVESLMSDPANPLRNFAFSTPNLYHEASGSPAMDEPVPAVVTTKEEALALMDRTFETCDQSLLAPTVRAMTDAED